MAVIRKKDKLQKSEENWNVVLVKKYAIGYLLNHKACGEMIIYVDAATTPRCPHCDGEIIFPNIDW